MKTCSICKIEKEEAEFYTRKKNRKRILSYACKSCICKHAKMYSVRTDRVSVSKKICKTCGKEKDISCFYRNNRKKDSHNTSCKLCEAAKRRFNLNANIGISVDSKVCPSCEKKKDASLFDVHSGNKDGLQRICKQCRRVLLQEIKMKRIEYPPIPPARKICSRCKVEKEGSGFYKSCYSTDGLTSCCIDCTRSAQRVFAENRGDVSMPEEKVCSKCGLKKTASCFYRSKYSPDGINYWCKDCMRLYGHNPERMRQKNYSRKMRINGNTSRAIFISDKDWRDVLDLFGNRCPSCNREFSEENKATCDHIIPLSRGGSHSLDNVQPLCLVCNSKKYTKTIDYRQKKVSRLRK